MKVLPMRLFIYLVLSLMFFSLVWEAELFAQTGEIPVDPQVLRNIVKIETFSELKKELSYGTGFIVSREITVGSGNGRFTFLVTNKHMVSDWTLADGSIAKFNKYLDVHFYRTEIGRAHV